MIIIGVLFYLVTAFGLLYRLYPEGAKRNLRSYVIVWSITWLLSIPLTLVWQSTEPWRDKHLGRVIKSKADWLWEIR